MENDKNLNDLQNNIKHHIDNPREIPFKTYIHESVEFKVINHHQANDYLKSVTNLLGTEHLYDVFNDYVSFPDYDKNGFFLLAEEDVEMETLSLEYEYDEKINILGIIFLKNLTVKKCIIGYDIDFSPILVVFGNTSCPNIHIIGNTYFFQGQIRAELIWGFYNHSKLYCHDFVFAQAIVIDDMDMEIGNIENVKSIINLCNPDLNVPREFYLDDTETTTEIRMTHVLSTHNIEDVLIAEVLDKDNCFSYENDSELNAIQEILKGKSILKPEFIANYFYENFHLTVQEKLISVFNLPILKIKEHRTTINDTSSFVFDEVSNDANDLIKRFYLFDSFFHFSLSVSLNETENSIELEYVMYEDDDETTISYYPFPTDSTHHIANAVKNAFENCYKMIMKLKK